MFKGYDKDALPLTLLSYNVVVGRLLCYSNQDNSQLPRKVEQGDKLFYKEYLSFCRCKSKIFRGASSERCSLICCLII